MKGVDSQRGGDRSRAPSDGKAKPHWRWDDPDGLKKEYGVGSAELTPNAAVVEAAPLDKAEAATAARPGWRGESTK
ncbi:hypothetical protein, partial [Archangium violaceum]|uniref:hypothetical protein n=1 Tax=Archangium violaceum TaxID=83451 RepID=UPI001F32E596